MLWFVSISSTRGSVWTAARIFQMSCRKSYRHMNIKVVFQWLLWLYGISLGARSNLLAVKNGSCILFLPFCLKWSKAAVYSLEDSSWNAARVIWSLYSMYSHMCQDFAATETMRWGWLRGWQSKRSGFGIDRDGGTRHAAFFLFVCFYSSCTVSFV